MINVRQKGAGGEREIIDACEPLVRKVMEENGLPHSYASPVMQRNQNQSAVGGSDITNPFALAIEVKRQESLSVNTWWAQCVKAAQATNECPVLLYRQNGKKWRCVTYAYIELPRVEGSLGAQMQVLCEFDFPQFLKWFEEWVRRKVASSLTP